MNQPGQVFEVGDRVAYNSYRRRITGVVTAVKTESVKQEGKIVKVLAYTITTDGGGRVTKFGHYLQRIP